MVAIVFPFVMELLVVVLFAAVALPVWLATRLLDAIEDRRTPALTRRPSGRDPRR